MNKTWRTLSLNSYIVISLNWKNAALLYKETKLALFGCNVLSNTVCIYIYIYNIYIYNIYIYNIYIYTGKNN